MRNLGTSTCPWRCGFLTNPDLPEFSVRSLRSRLDRIVGYRDATADRLRAAQSEIQRLEDEDALLDLVGNLFRTLIDSEVTESVHAVEKLLTEGLQAVFDDQDLHVRSEVEVQRGKVSVDLITVQKQANGMITEGISNDAFGGAVTTVQSVLMRIIVLLRRGLRPLLLLDETLPAFDESYVHIAGRFLSVLCERLGLDILLVTHNPA